MLHKIIMHVSAMFRNCTGSSAHGKLCNWKLTIKFASIMEEASETTLLSLEEHAS
jgi:hypothetical protein